MVAKRAVLDEERQEKGTADAQQKSLLSQHTDEITQHQDTLRRSQQESLSGFDLKNAHKN